MCLNETVRPCEVVTLNMSNLRFLVLSSPRFVADFAEPRHPPVFDRKLSPKEVTVGDSIELECHMTGSAPIKVTWSKDHKDIRSGGNYKISCVNNMPHLTVLKADKANTGKYFCHASNDMGKDSCSSDITVKGISARAPLLSSLPSLL